MIVDQLFTSPAVVGNTRQFFNESRHNKLLKEDVTYRNFHNLSRMLAERAMSEKEILDLFAAVEAFCITDQQCHKKPADHKNDRNGRVQECCNCFHFCSRCFSFIRAASTYRMTSIADNFKHLASPSACHHLSFVILSRCLLRHRQAIPSRRLPAFSIGQ